MPKVEIITSCPLGHTCEEAKDGAIHRCNWYVRLQGKHPQSGDPMDEWGCAMAWTPILLVQNAGAGRSQAAAIESLRNEMVKGQQVFNTAITSAVTQRKTKELS